MSSAGSKLPCLDYAPPGSVGRASPKSSQRVRWTVVTLHLYQEMFGNYFSFIPRLLPAWMVLLCFLAPANSAEKTTPAASPEVIVIGFVGGFVRRNDTVHQEVQLAAHLRKQYPTRMQV